MFSFTNNKYKDFYITNDHTVDDACEMLHKWNASIIPVVATDYKVIGYLRSIDLAYELSRKLNRKQSIDSFIHTDYMYVYSFHNIKEILKKEMSFAMIVDENHVYKGLLLEKDIQSIWKQELSMNFSQPILEEILQSAYEGIAVVNKDGILIEMNDPYAQFIGVKRSEVIGKHVTDIIENTKLHITVQNAIPERNVLQQIQGQDMIVHRIPIWQGDEVVGAIGMLMFEGVQEVYNIYRKLQMEKDQMNAQVDLQNKEETSTTDSMDKIVGMSDIAKQLKQQIRKLASQQQPVFIVGEKGTGKETFARTISHLSLKYQTFKHLNGLDANSVKETLHSLINEYNTTVFIENVLYLPEELQQLLQQKMSTYTSIRFIIANIEKPASNSHWNNKVDLIYIPPLRTRKKDITFLLSHYLQEFCYTYQISQKTYTSEAVRALLQYDWPRNVEELIEIVENLVLNVDDDEIQLKHLPNHIQETMEIGNTWLEDIKNKKREEERRMIWTALEEAGGNKTKAASLLGIHRTTLYKKIKEFEIDE